MARLPDDVVSRTKQDVPLLRLVEGQGHKVIKQGKDHVVQGKRMKYSHTKKQFF